MSIHKIQPNQYESYLNNLLFTSDNIVRDITLLFIGVAPGLVSEKNCTSPLRQWLVLQHDETGCSGFGLFLSLSGILSAII